MELKLLGSLWIHLFVSFAIATGSSGEKDTAPFTWTAVSQNQTTPVWKVGTYVEFQEIAEQDPHPLHGCPVNPTDPTKGVLFAGQSWFSTKKRRGYVVKIEQDGTAGWSGQPWQYDKDVLSSDSVALSVVSDGTTAFVVGTSGESGEYNAYLGAISVNDGGNKWIYNWKTSTKGPKNGAFWESITLCPGDGIYFGGATEMNTAEYDAYFFKSSGSPETDGGAQAIVGYLPLSSTNALPVESSFTYHILSGYDRVISIDCSHTKSGEGPVALIDKKETLVKFNKGLAGSAVAWIVQPDWTSVVPPGRVTDISRLRSTNNNGDYILGGYGNTFSPWAARIGAPPTKSQTPQSVTPKWARGDFQLYGGGGVHGVLFNECWGISGYRDGAVLGCGWGVEGCDQFSAPPNPFGDNVVPTEAQLEGYAKACKAGNGAFAVPLDVGGKSYLKTVQAGVWKSLTLYIEGENGDVVWKIIDADHESNLGKPASDGGSVANEEVITFDNAGGDGGTVYTVLDVAAGIGVSRYDDSGKNPSSSSGKSGTMKWTITGKDGTKTDNGTTTDSNETKDIIKNTRKPTTGETTSSGHNSGDSDILSNTVLIISLIVTSAVFIQGRQFVSI